MLNSFGQLPVSMRKHDENSIVYVLYIKVYVVIWRKQITCDLQVFNLLLIHCGYPVIYKTQECKHILKMVHTVAVCHWMIADLHFVPAGPGLPPTTIFHVHRML